jgi:hypothetical protein
MTAHWFTLGTKAEQVQWTEEVQIVLGTDRYRVHWVGTSEQQGKPAATVAAFLRAEDKSLFLEALVLQQALRAKDRDAVQQALRAIATMPL